jgi:hypothetical protein
VLTNRYNLATSRAWQCCFRCRISAQSVSVGVGVCVSVYYIREGEGGARAFSSYVLFSFVLQRRNKGRSRCDSPGTLPGHARRKLNSNSSSSSSPSFASMHFGTRISETLKACSARAARRQINKALGKKLKGKSQLAPKKGCQPTSQFSDSENGNNCRACRMQTLKGVINVGADQGAPRAFLSQHAALIDHAPTRILSPSGSIDFASSKPEFPLPL